MSMPRPGLRLAHLAVGLMVGILLATSTGCRVAPPSVWVVGALACAAAIPRQWARTRLLLVVACIGGARAALAPLPDLATLQAVPGVDDRELDELRGPVAGPVVDVAGRRSFVVVDQTGLAVLVTARQPLPEVLPGDQVVVAGRLRSPRGYRVPGAVDLRPAVVRRGATHTMAVDGSAVQVVAPGGSLWRGPVRTQRALAGVVASRGGDPGGNAVVRAMVLGDRSGLDPDLVAGFRAAGVSHVLAVSGLHLAVVTWLVFLLVRRLWGLWPALAARIDADVAAALAATPAAVGYALVTGGRVSTLRALLVVLLVLGGIVIARRARILDALGFAALVLLAASPTTLFDPGFQLSFGATATLVLALPGRSRHGLPSPGVVGWASGLALRAVDLGRASLWVTLATAPLVAAWFGEVATGGVVANLLVVPLATLVIVPVGLVGALVGALWPAGGGLLIDLAVLAAKGSVACAGAVGTALPAVAVSPPTRLELCAALVVWIAAIGWVRGRWRPAAAVLVAGLGLATWAGSWWVTAELAPRARSTLEVSFLDVGDGDAAVLELPGGAVWLIDSGGLPFTPADADPGLAAVPGERSVLRFLAHRRIRRIDRVILSHPHPDHYAGLRALLGRVDIGEVWVARHHLERPPDVDYRALLIELALRGVPIVHPLVGQRVVEHGVALEVLFPRYLGADAAADPVLSVNDNSLVVMVERAGQRILFAGDLEHEGEEILVADHPGRLGAAVVKVPHHGSKTSSWPPLVAATRPRWAVISCGVANRYGAPAEAVVSRWRDAGARVLRTDRDGAITVSIAADGAIEVTTFDHGVASP